MTAKVLEASKVKNEQALKKNGAERKTSRQCPCDK